MEMPATPAGSAADTSEIVSRIRDLRKRRLHAPRCSRSPRAGFSIQIFVPNKYQTNAHSARECRLIPTEPIRRLISSMARKKQAGNFNGFDNFQLANATMRPDD